MEQLTWCQQGLSSTDGPYSATKQKKYN